MVLIVVVEYGLCVVIVGYGWCYFFCEIVLGCVVLFFLFFWDLVFDFVGFVEDEVFFICELVDYEVDYCFWVVGVYVEGCGM